MKKHRVCRFAPFYLVPALLLAGCMTQDAEYIRRDINTLQRQIDDLQQEIRNSRSFTVPQQTGALEGRKGQADLEAELESVRMNLDTLTAQVEDSQQLTRRVSMRLDALEAGLTTRFDALQTQVDQLMAGTEEAETAQTQPTRLPQEAKEVPLAEAEEPTSVETMSARVSSDVENAYRAAYQDFQRGNLDQAKEKFSAFLKQHPETPLSDNAQFWIGEIAFKRHQYEAAILAYEDVIRNYPDSNKLPDAILKQGLAFLELGDRIDARIVLENLVKKYPNSEQAKIAKSKLQTLR